MFSAVAFWARVLRPEVPRGEVPVVNTRSAMPASAIRKQPISQHSRPCANSNR